jgi:hypothetical protein
MELRLTDRMAIAMEARFRMHFGLEGSWWKLTEHERDGFRAMARPARTAHDAFYDAEISEL